VSWRLRIAGVDYSVEADMPTISIMQSNKHRGGIMTCDVNIAGKAKPRPKSLQSIYLEHVTAGSADWRLFGGVIATSEQYEIQPTTYGYHLTCVDLTRFLDHVPIGASVYTGAVSDVVKQIVQDWAAPGNLVTGALSDPAPDAPITTNHVQDLSVQVYGFQPLYIPVSAALDQLARMVYASWWVDPYGDIYFCMPDSTWARAPLPTVAPVTFFNQDLVAGEPVGMTTQSLPLLDADVDWAEYRDLRIAEDATQLITCVHARDYQEVSTVPAEENPSNNAKLRGDGSTRFFPLYNTPVDPAHTLVYVDAKEYSTGRGNLRTEYIDGTPAAPTEDDWCFVCQSNQGIRFNLAPPSQSSIRVIYNYYANGQDVMKNLTLAAEVAAREGFGGGRIYQILSDPTLTQPISLSDGTPPWLAAEQITLSRYGRIKYKATFSTRRSGWRPGQVFAIQSARRGDQADAASYNTWGQTFRQRFWVVQTSTKLNNDDVADTRVEAHADIWGE